MVCFDWFDRLVTRLSSALAMLPLALEPKAQGRASGIVMTCGKRANQRVEGDAFVYDYIHIDENRLLVVKCQFLCKRVFRKRKFINSLK